jgi:hypothetical protein
MTLAIALLSAALGMGAQQPDAVGWLPVLQVRAVSSTPEGSRVGVAGQWKIVKDGDPLAMTFLAGPTLCRMGVGSGDSGLPPDAGTSRVMWVVTGNWLGEQAGRQQMRITSKFLRLGGRESSASTTQTLSLRDGDEVTLDAVSEPVDSGCNVHTVTFNARLAMQPATPALAQTTYAADLWLIHDGPFNAQMRDHLIVNVNGMTSVPFMFKPLSFSLPQADPRQGNISASISLSGTLRGRARPDGLVDVDLETNPLVYGITSPASAPPLTSMLRKTLTLKPGETTAVEFPPPSSGVSSVPVGPDKVNGQFTGMEASSPDGLVHVANGVLVVDTSRFFKGHKTQLLITLKRLQ